MTDVPQAAKDLLEKPETAKLLETIKIGDDVTYYIVSQGDQDAGEPVFLRVDGGGHAEVTTDIKPEDQTAGGAAPLSTSTQDFLRAYRGDESEADGLAGGGALDQATLNAQFLKTAKKMARDGFSSAHAPGTDGGNLACAWAVNQCARKGLGKAIGGGLATANMVVVLRKHHRKTAQPVSGAVVISASATVGGKWVIGHVGVLGDVDPVNEDDTPIYSNSSSEAKFMKNFTLGKWRDKYQSRKNLKVEFFELEPSLFPGASGIADA